MLDDNYDPPRASYGGTFRRGSHPLLTAVAIAQDRLRLPRRWHRWIYMIAVSISVTLCLLFRFSDPLNGVAFPSELTHIPHFTSLGVPVARRSGLEMRSNGVAVLQNRMGSATPSGPLGKRGFVDPDEHPFYELMERAEDKWETMIGRQSTTLEAAVAEYRRRYNLDPPLGFDAWFAFCQAHGITMIDEYDQLMRDLLVHHALEPSESIARTNALLTNLDTYEFGIKLNTSGAYLFGPRTKPENIHPWEYRELLDPLKTWLPDGFEVTVPGSDHDTGSQILGQDQRRRAMELVKQGEHFTSAELERLQSPNRTPAWGWFKACDLDSPANARPNAEAVMEADKSTRSYIWDHFPTMNFCDWPELKRIHGAMSMDYYERSPSKLKPILVWSKFPGDASYQSTAMHNISEINATTVAASLPWESRTDRRMFWRGHTTGGYAMQEHPRDIIQDWKESHRHRLHFMFKGYKNDPDAYWFNRERVVLQPHGERGYELEKHSDKELAKAYGDVSAIGHAHFCDSELSNRRELCALVNSMIDYSPRVNPEDTENYRYMLDVDGNGWSSRFRRLLASGGMVIKMTTFPEWNQEWMVPWYHYVPTKVDYSDLYDISAFFMGPLNSDGTVNYSKGHDHLAKKIAEHGQQFVIDHWNHDAMRAYNFRLLLEIRRLNSLDREAMSYKL